MRRLADQVEILEAIKAVRLELRIAHMKGESSIAIMEIMTRLTTLYSLVDTSSLILAAVAELRTKVRRVA